MGTLARGNGKKAASVRTELPVLTLEVPTVVVGLPKVTQALDGHVDPVQQVLLVDQALVLLQEGLDLRPLEMW